MGNLILSTAVDILFADDLKIITLSTGNANSQYIVGTMHYSRA